MSKVNIPEMPQKLLLIDDDPFFRTLMSATAESMGIELKTFESVAEMGSFARIKDFAAAILDFNLEHLNGVEIAEYIDTFFNDIPVLIVTGGDVEKISNMRWPECIKAVKSKTRTPRELISDACRYLERQNFLKSFDVPRYTELSQQVAD